MVKLASWNVNGIRACHNANFLGWLRGSQPDLVGLQEVRAEEHQVPAEIREEPGFHKAWFAASSKKGYSGVGVLSRVPPLRVIKGMGAPEFDAEGRAMAAEFKGLVFVSAYFPNSQDGGKRIDYKIAYCDRMLKWLEELRKETKKPVVLCGDYNIAHEEIDLARPDSNHDSPGFLPAERAWMTKFLEAGWVDTFRHLHPEKVQYSWWSARTRARERNIGWRIDYHAIHKSDAKLIKGAEIEDDVLGSDHCPVTLKLDVTL
jgi:exodeoxyribonuclease-3